MDKQVSFVKGVQQLHNMLVVMFGLKLWNSSELSLCKYGWLHTGRLGSCKRRPLWARIVSTRWCELVSCKRTASNPGQMAGVTASPDFSPWLSHKSCILLSPIATILVQNLQRFCPELAFLKLWNLFPSFQSQKLNYIAKILKFYTVLA